MDFWESKSGTWTVVVRGERVEFMLFKLIYEILKKIVVFLRSYTSGIF